MIELLVMVTSAEEFTVNTMRHLVPIMGERAHSLICMYVNRKEEEEGETEQNYRAINLPIVI